jgi:hypothetical protein
MFRLLLIVPALLLTAVVVASAGNFLPMHFRDFAFEFTH